jgi:hypothetical protein
MSGDRCADCKRLLAAWLALDCDCKTPGTVKCREAIREGFQRPLREEAERLRAEVEALRGEKRDLASQLDRAATDRRIALAAAQKRIEGLEAALRKLLDALQADCGVMDEGPATVCTVCGDADGNHDTDHACGESEILLAALRSAPHGAP